MHAHSESIAVEELGQHGIETVAVLFTERGRKHAPVHRRAPRTDIRPGNVFNERCPAHIAVVQNLSTALGTDDISVLARHVFGGSFFRVHSVYCLSKITTFHIVVGSDLFKHKKRNMNDGAGEKTSHIACIERHEQKLLERIREARHQVEGRQAREQLREM